MGNSRSEFENSLHQSSAVKSLTPFQLSFSILIKKLSRIQCEIQQYYHGGGMRDNGATTSSASSSPASPSFNSTTVGQKRGQKSSSSHHHYVTPKCYKHEKILLLKLLDRAEEMMVECKQLEGAMDIDWQPYERAMYAMRKRVMSLQEKEDLTSMEVLQDPPELKELGLD